MAEPESVSLARVAEGANRYDDMAEFMKEHVESGAPLDAEQREMLSAAFKNALSDRRGAVRTAMEVIKERGEAGDLKQQELAQNYKSLIESEHAELCRKVLALLRERLVPAAQAGEEKTFYLKMEGDYCRYLAEVSTGERLQQAADGAAQAYYAGLQEAESLSSVHQVRLGLALNYSVFQHEVLQDKQGAINTAHHALQSAVETQEEVHQEAETTLRLMQDNLALWTSQ
eukprot:TRINITY_DN110657_c0_g1_i1.p1 TRINITY_DN110657_c0_g1~~TRINITY_DN110657_c0_g1_i1.p1  ORF type:complete len:249 (-),score=61.72 TRINITY_DN110657_c0_g1_i1:118-804(-)